ncbi:MAG: iron complex transport system ATP-binding protein [Chloroflexi bacterium]|nr:MAG: iron complex transport system ATP-binding protein [Chloroflexota bacterium]
MSSSALTTATNARSDTPALSLSDIRFRYGRAALLEGLSLHVSAGEIVGLLGRNGSGKTTALRLVTGTLQPASGVVQVAGRERRAWRRRALARELALVPQELQVAFDFTVEELVRLGRAPHVGWLRGHTTADLDAARTAMRAVAIDDLATRRYRDLSGGEKQRVALAIALAQEPSLLLLDEPTHNLDLAQQALFFQTLERLTHERRLGVLAVIHDVNLAALWCDRLLMLADGRILADGTPEQVLTPDNLRRCYGVEARLLPHPDNGRPQVFLSQGTHSHGQHSPAR